MNRSRTRKQTHAIYRAMRVNPPVCKDHRRFEWLISRFCERVEELTLHPERINVMPPDSENKLLTLKGLDR